MKRLILIAVILLLSSSIALAQDFCKGDFNYDRNCDADDVTTFLADFGRSIFNNPCPPDGPAPAVWSGQMTSYATGDDGDLERGVHWAIPRFLDNGNGTLTDKATGLIWMKNANCFGQRTWNNALSDCNALASGQCGLTDGSNAGDWRLPSVRELHSVIDYSQHDPAIGFFALLLIQNLESDYYWSSTTVAGGTEFAWGVTMYTGDMVNVLKNVSIFYVWPVRGGH